MARDVIIRTSDRISFKRCRRKWKWSSHLGHYLEQDVKSAPLWLGTGVHFSLEDVHGYKRYPSGADALRAYTNACKTVGSHTLPDGWKEQLELGCGMMDYYEDHWLHNRDSLKTYYVDEVPQCEAKFSIPLTEFCPPDLLEKYDVNSVTYQGTLDRVTIDEDGNLWVNEYKTAKAFATRHFETDCQVSAYVWAASCVYSKPIAGVIYQQHRKDLPELPRVLSTGKFSLNKQQLTTHHLYREALLNLYGRPEKFPLEYVQFLGHLAEQEHENSDKYVRRDIVFRTKHQIAAEGEKIILELEDMLNENLPLYPNPTRDCAWDCDFQSPCISMDDGSDWEDDLSSRTIERSKETDPWRKHL